MLPAGGESPPEIFLARLNDRAPAFGLTLPLPALDRLARYLAFVDLWRRRTNLTGPIDADSLADHALECALGADLLPAGPVADIGSGAGFPGIPLALLRKDVVITPVEPRRLRREFLNLAARELRLENVTLSVPSVRGLPASTIRAAVARAVGGIADILAEPAFLAPRALFLAWTTEPETLARDLGGHFRLRKTHPVPTTQHKTIAVFQRV
ncbi:MAG: RsmG family class I SAM-dependent methyltransferase [Acidobacteriota bacterium]